MGLDQYLYAERYVTDYEFYPDDKREAYRRLVEAMGVEDAVDPHTPSATVSFTVAYWRKANQIHRWFVEHCQGGVDDCRRADVTRSQLEELRDLCKKVLDSSRLVAGTVVNGQRLTDSGWEDITSEGRVVEDAAVAQELLPSTDGFFFGSTDYDEWYWRDLESTVEQIDRALALPEDWDFTYRSSW